MNMENMFCEEQCVRFCVMPPCGWVYGIVRDTVCDCDSVCSGWVGRVGQCERLCTLGGGVVLRMMTVTALPRDPEWL